MVLNLPDEEEFSAKLEQIQLSRFRKIFRCYFKLEKGEIVLDIPEQILPHLHHNEQYTIILGTKKPELRVERRILMKGELLRKYDEKRFIVTFGGLLAQFRLREAPKLDIREGETYYLSVNPKK